MGWRWAPSRPAASKSPAGDALLLDAVRSFLLASRVSSGDVLEALASAVFRCDGSFDALLCFVPRDGDLVCVVSRGARVEHFLGTRMRREATTTMPGRAAARLHHVSGVDGVLVPTDRRAIAVPMHDRAGLHGVTYASSASPGPIAQIDTLVRLVEYATLPFALANERECDRASATYDGLTGLLTPRAFRTQLASDVARRRLGGPPVMSLWFIDTDHFKAVNDTYGHATGDAVLQTMAELLRTHTVRDVDIVGRNGGDEFCALIVDAQKSVAIERAQAFCDAVRECAFPASVRLTASVGVATLPYDTHDSSELLEIADSAMYHSKRNGRDRVSFSIDGTEFATYREGGKALR